MTRSQIQVQAELLIGMITYYVENEKIGLAPHQILIYKDMVKLIQLMLEKVKYVGD
jgi:hypothetical protein